jgi:hypothetical protein
MLARLVFIAATAILLTSCSGLKVRQQDLDAWVGLSVEALDTHSFFITVPMIRTRTESGIEIRNYANGQNMASCAGFGNANAYGSWVQANAFSNCSSGWVGCNNIFYIKDGKVLEYAPTGQCYTDETVQPQARYKRFRASTSSRE